MLTLESIENEDYGGKWDVRVREEMWKLQVNGELIKKYRTMGQLVNIVFF